MGTVASIRVHDDIASDVVGRHVDAALVELHRLERVFSTFLSNSEISRINRGEIDVLDARREVLEVLDSCTWLEHASGGVFDAHRPDDPTQLDPAGFVKGWAAERAADRLRAGGLQHWWFGVGGDVIVHGHPTEHRMWQVAIADPLHPGEIIGVVDAADGAVATSGTTERGTHVWDGRTRTRADALVSFTVTGPSLTWADAFATTGLAMGPTGVDWVGRFDGYHALALSPDGTLCTSPAFGVERVDPPSA
jgi:thiamine biosynthesis lipoprotein